MPRRRASAQAIGMGATETRAPTSFSSVRSASYSKPRGATSAWKARLYGIPCGPPTVPTGQRPLADREVDGEPLPSSRGLQR